METLGEFEPLRQATHVTTSTNPWPSNNIQMNMQTKDALSKIDKMTMHYLAVADNDSIAEAIQSASKQAMHNLTSQSSPDEPQSIIDELEKTLKELVYGASVDESIDAKSSKAVEVAFKSAWALSNLSASQQQTLKQAIEEIDKHGSMQASTANKLLLLIGKPQTDANTETMLAIVEDAFFNPDDVLVDESNVAHQVEWLSFIVDEAVAILPRSLEHLYDGLTGQTKTAQSIVNDLQAIVKRQTSPSALIASQYVETLKQNLNDWTLAMKYGATHGVPNGKSIVQASLLANSEKYQSFMKDLQDLLINIGKTFQCAPSMDTVKSELGYEFLRVKLIQNWGQAEAYTYQCFATILQSLNVEAQLKQQGAALYLLISIDRNQIIDSAYILTADQAQLKCIEIATTAFDKFVFSANNIIAWYNSYIKKQSPNWWNAINVCRKAFSSNSKDAMAAMWMTYDLPAKLAALCMLKSDDAQMFAKSAIGDIAWYDVPEVCKEEFATTISSNA